MVADGLVAVQDRVPFALGLLCVRRKAGKQKHAEADERKKAYLCGRMEEDSAFFGPGGACEAAAGTAPVLVHRSESGWCEVWRVVRDGRFVAVKALRPEFRGQTRYEARLRKEFDLTYVFIGHDLAVVQTIADRIAVMYAGLIVEELRSEELDKAQHPYTKRLLQSVFSVHDRNQKVIQVEEMGVTAAHQIPGCPFQPRCTLATAECEGVCPSLRELEPDHRAACLAL